MRQNPLLQNPEQPLNPQPQRNPGAVPALPAGPRLACRRRASPATERTLPAGVQSFKELFGAGYGLVRLDKVLQVDYFTPGHVEEVYSFARVWKGCYKKIRGCCTALRSSPGFFKL